MAEQLSWMAEPWLPGAWDPQLFLQGKSLGRGTGRVPLGAGRRAVLASPNLEGNTVNPLRQHCPLPHPPAGAPPPAEAYVPLSPATSPRAVVVPPQSRSLEARSRARADVMIPLDTVLLSNVLASFSLAVFQSIADLLTILSRSLLQYLSPDA